MDDQMIDLLAGDTILRQRLQAYAEARLTPDLATTARIRARVLAGAHRRADLARADAALTVVRPASAQPAAAARPHGRRRQQVLTALLAASLAAGVGVGSAFAARPGGALYETRLWAETLTLPSDPSQRALAELDRLKERLAEAADAINAGDAPAATAALDAYARIVDTASSDALAANDDVAAAALKTGVGRNIQVLQALVSEVPATAVGAITRALTRAIDRSDGAIVDIDQDAGGRNGNGGGQTGGAPGKPAATDKPAGDPTATPTKKPAGENNGQTGNGQTGNGQSGNGQTGNGNGGGGAGGPTSTDHPAKPEHTPKP